MVPSKKKEVTPPQIQRPHLRTTEAFICGFMMFHGKRFAKRRISAKYGHMLEGRKISYKTMERALKVGKKSRNVHRVYEYLFRVNRKNSPICEPDGRPIFYYGRRRIILKMLAISEVKRYDSVVDVRLLYNCSRNQTKVIDAELGFKNGRFYYRYTKTKRLRKHIPDEVLSGWRRDV